MAGVPNWLTTGPPSPGSPPFNLPCTGMAPGQLRGCDTAVVANRHPAYAVGTAITITRGDGTTFNTNITAAAAANSATITVGGLTNTQIAQVYTFSRNIYVGEDPVVCTGFSRQPASIDSAANTLTGCTVAAPARRSAPTIRSTPEPPRRPARRC